MSAPPVSGDLTVDAIRAHLQTNSLGQTIRLLDETPSTNTAALALSRDRAPHGTVVVAERQTAGRGRLRREWFSPSGGNLYCSVLLRRTIAPHVRERWLSWIPLITGVAAARGIRRVTGLDPCLKWPNDILVGGKKAGGVLCETTGAGEATPCVVIGIGINVNTAVEDFPEEFREQATTLASEAGVLIDRATLLAAVLLELETRSEALAAGQDPDLAREYSGLCSTLGQRVRVSLIGGTTHEGRASTIGSDGSLHIVPDGTREDGGGDPLVVRAGDVTHLR